MTPIQRVRVPLGFLFVGIYLYLARPTPLWWFAGTAVAGAGLALRVWASGHLQKWEQLAVAGPYRYTRNPLYLGSFIMGLGFAAASARPLLAGVFLVAFSIVYFPVMAREEAELEQAFGSDFAEYRRQVPRFLPRVGRPFRAFSGGGGNFLWEWSISNREYQAVIGYIVLSAALLAKMLWL